MLLFSTFQLWESLIAQKKQQILVQDNVIFSRLWSFDTFNKTSNCSWKYTLLLDALINCVSPSQLQRHIHWLSIIMANLQLPINQDHEVRYILNLHTLKLFDHSALIIFLQHSTNVLIIYNFQNTLLIWLLFILSRHTFHAAKLLWMEWISSASFFPLFSSHGARANR